MLQNDKTKILSADDFSKLAETMLIDRPANEKEKEILALIAKKTGGDTSSQYIWRYVQPTDEQKEQVIEELF